MVLLSEQITTVTDSGDIRTVYRKAYKILRPEGRYVGVVGVSFNKDTRLTFLKGWCVPVEGKDYEVKEKEAVETSLFSEEMYSDDRSKLVKIPASEPGNVVGYEYEQRQRPRVLSLIWNFQEELPVVRARFELHLPAGWEYGALWLRHVEQKPQQVGENAWAWDVQSLPAIEDEPEMPDWRALAGRMGVTYYPREPIPGLHIQHSWRDVALFQAELTADRRQDSPEIRQKSLELTAPLKAPLEKIRALTEFLQREIRYVAIEIGIGGYQPHPASDVFTNRYGDCKDKATLLSTMLKDIGIDSYYVVINDDRGVATPEFPTPLNFNHVILAIKLPPEVPRDGLWAVIDFPGMGPILFFDPTNPYVPLGYIPDYLQSNYGLLVTDSGGELVKLPLLPPSVNRRFRQAKLILEADGTVSGEVSELRWGGPAVNLRANLLRASQSERQKLLENILGSYLDGSILQSASVGNLEKLDGPLTLSYRFSARNYAKIAGNLILLRPHVLGNDADSVLESGGEKERSNPVEFRGASAVSDVVEITLPPGYEPEELPAPAKLDMGPVSFKSSMELKGNVLYHTSLFEVKDVLVPKERLNDLKQFYRHVGGIERATAVLKQSVPQAAP